MNFLSIRSKLLIMVLSLGIALAVTIAWTGWSIGKEALTKAKFEELTAVKEAKKHELEAYFEDLVKDFSIIATDPSLPAIMSDLDTAFKQIDTGLLERELQDGLTGHELLVKHYDERFFPDLPETGGEPHYNNYAPRTPQGEALQIAYTASNPAPWGEKQERYDSGYLPAYDAVHARVHERLLQVTDARNYEDLFLINPDGNIIYTAYKETDLGVNVKEGVIARSSLKAAFERAASNGNDGAVILEDFKAYPANFFAPAGFLTSPVFNDGNFVGVVATQLPVEDMGDTMTGGANWRAHGLGETGETYLVGPDRLMRSSSRFLIEDKENYIKALERLGVPKQQLAIIETSDTSVLVQPVDTPAITAAFRGEVGTTIVDDYRGVPVLSSYGLVDAAGLRWAILSEIDAAEAYAPITRFRNLMIMVTTGAAILLALLALWLAGAILRPVEVLAKTANRLAAGERGARVPEDGSDEFSVLGKNFNAMAAEMEQRADKVQAQADAYETMLRSVFPDMIAERLGAGDSVIAETHENVSVLIVLVDSIEALMVDRGADETLKLLNDLMGSFDAAAERFGIDKVKTLGEIYVGVCSLSGHRVDHVRRCINAASAFKDIVENFNDNHGFNLSIQAGTASGEIDGGIVGTQRLVYDVWGTPVVAARRAAEQAALGTIAVTASSLEQLKTHDTGSADKLAAVSLGSHEQLSEDIYQIDIDPLPPTQQRRKLK